MREKPFVWREYARHVYKAYDYEAHLMRTLLRVTARKLLGARKMKTMACYLVWGMPTSYGQDEWDDWANKSLYAFRRLFSSNQWGMKPDAIVVATMIEWPADTSLRPDLSKFIVRRLATYSKAARQRIRLILSLFSDCPKDKQPQGLICVFGAWGIKMRQCGYYKRNAYQAVRE